MAGGINWTLDTPGRTNSDTPAQSTGGSSLDNLMKLLSMGGSGFNPTDMAVGFGGQLLGGLGNLLRGRTDAQKNSKKVFDLAQNRLGQSVIEPEQFLAEYMRSMLPDWNNSAQALEKRLGLDSGVASGGLAMGRESDIAKFMLNAKLQDAQLKSRSDNMLLSLMGQMAGRT